MGKHHSPRFLQLVQEAKKHIRETTVDEVKARLDRGEKLCIVDVREESEWAKDHLPGAVYLGKGVIERDVEQRLPDCGRGDHPLLRRRFSLGAGGGESAEDGLHERPVDGRRCPRLARQGLSADIRLSFSLRLALQSSQRFQTLTNQRLMAAIDRLIIAASFRQVRLRHPAHRRIVAVLITFVAELLCAAVMRIAQMLRHRQRSSGTYILARSTDRHCRGIGLRSRGDIGDGLRQRELAFGQADELTACRAAAATTSACGSALPTSSDAQMTMRRAMKRGSSPASSIRASQ